MITRNLVAIAVALQFLEVPSWTQQPPSLASPRNTSISSVFEVERSCTYRGGPKGGIWSCQ